MTQATTKKTASEREQQRNIGISHRHSRQREENTQCSMFRCTQSNSAQVKQICAYQIVNLMVTDKCVKNASHKQCLYIYSWIKWPINWIVGRKWEEPKKHGEHKVSHIFNLSGIDYRHNRYVRTLKPIYLSRSLVNGCVFFSVHLTPHLSST